MQYWSSNLGNDRPRSLAVETLLRDGNIQFWTSTHLWSAAEERKKKSWRQPHFTVSQLHHLWTRMCCRHRTILTHENSQALTAHPSTRREIPTLLLLLLKRDYAGYMQTQTMTILQYTFVLMKWICICTKQPSLHGAIKCPTLSQHLVPRASEYPAVSSPQISQSGGEILGGQQKKLSAPKPSPQNQDQVSATEYMTCFRIYAVNSLFYLTMCRAREIEGARDGPVGASSAQISNAHITHALLVHTEEQELVFCWQVLQIKVTASGYHCQQGWPETTFKISWRSSGSVLFVFKYIKSL